MVLKAAPVCCVLKVSPWNCCYFQLHTPHLCSQVKVIDKIIIKHLDIEKPHTLLILLSRSSPRCAGGYPFQSTGWQTAVNWTCCWHLTFVQLLVSALEIYLHQHSICANQIKEWIWEKQFHQFWFLKVQISSLTSVPEQLHKPLCWLSKGKTCCYKRKGGGKHIQGYLPLITNTHKILQMLISISFEMCTRQPAGCCNLRSQISKPLGDKQI